MSTEVETEKLISWVLDSVKSDGVQNYVLNGLDSHLLAMKKGRVRMFTANIDTADYITPHSHRFDFFCVLLSGAVKHRTWVPDGHAMFDPSGAREFQMARLSYQGAPGRYKKSELEGAPTLWSPLDDIYETPGDMYGLLADEIHSIGFTAGTKVLFIEGADVKDWSSVLFPVVRRGSRVEVVNTLLTGEHHFRKEE